MLTSRAWIYVGLAAGAATAFGLVSLLESPKIRPGDRILLVGDSLAVGLTAPLKALAAERGVPFQALATVGTRIDQWAQSDALSQALESFQPTLVLISLGTNDAYMQPSANQDIGQRQAPYMEALLQKIEQYTHKSDYGLGPRAIVWLSPPTLPAAAISLPSVMRLIESEHQVSLPKIKPRVSFFPTQSLTLPRGPDGIHPVARGYAAWAGALWQWLT
ncbi:MAG TPA: SGNH/GDSL hydrolase family protein [Gemmatimonadaceae bacterium]|nr:SGNH/GDSL hydrolase family protein [Gemmatimonadaceae bacterium]